MQLRRLMWGLVVVGVLAVAMGWPSSLQAQGAVTFKLSAASAYLRDIPNAQAERTYSIFNTRSYVVLGRTDESTWLKLDFAGATRGTWVPANYGTVDGSLNFVPVVAAVPSGGGSVGGGAVVVPAVGTPTPGPTPFPDEVVPGAVGAAGPVQGRLTITVASTYLRSAPSYNATRVASVFRNAVLDVVGRDATAGWLQLSYGGAVWAPVGVGSYSGNVMSLPVAGGLPVPTVAPGQEPLALPPWIPVMTPRMRALYNLAAQRGRNMRAFAIAGDCNSESYLYSDLIANGWYGYEGNEYLHNTWLWFGRSMRRPLFAVDGGHNTASVMDPLFSNPQYCKPGEAPFACELRVSNASVVFILLGTGDQFTWERFETNYRRLIDHSLENNVLPVLVTKADRLESEEGGAVEGYINNVIRRLAAEYELPLFDFHQAIQNLPNRGLTDEPGHDFHLNAEAIGVHVLGTMQTLYSIRFR